MESGTMKRSRWGRARFGGSSGVLISISLAIGAAISTGAGALFVALGDVERPILAFALMTMMSLPASAALGWALLVDRSTLAGALEKPDDSIESGWYDKAASGAFGDVLLVGGLGAAGFAVAWIDGPLTWAVSGLVLFAMLDFAVRHQWLKRSEA
ncbi:hypothetical protein [Nesterenkonia halotolerans]|uniref:Uncharacterized protein n=1 Tax=Nesterenkonia halotolerans TaxID=225325 RepID=A0ABR9J416_9MICC|nr:hypothetical protein [Nesterenkonia halotolerans]MBE1513736.1 hypothetical protein [Nesterenkonia halotolerans]